MKCLTLYLITPEKDRTLNTGDFVSRFVPPADEMGSEYIAAENLAAALRLVGEENVLHIHRIGRVILDQDS